MKKIFFVILIVVGLSLPLFVSAQSILSGPLVPCGTKENPTPCTICDIFIMIRNIVNFILEAIFVFAIIFIAVGGIMYLTAGAKPDNAELGKRIVTNAIIGVIIALASWAILNTIFVALYPTSKGFPWPWNEVRCTGGGITDGGEENPVAYCACEYRSAYSDKSIKATQISGYDDNLYTCQQLCTSSSSTTYCSATATITGSENMYCVNASDSRLNRQAACMSNQESWNRIGTSCYATIQDCNSAADIQFHDTCYENGTLKCQCNSDAPSGVTDPCTSSSQTWTLFKHGSAFLSCQNDVIACSGAGCSYCELGCPTDGGGNVTLGTCTGVACVDSGLNICGQTSNNCSISQVNNWNAQIQSAASGRSICSGVDTVKLVKAVMARESGGDISRVASDGQSAGLMQLVPATAGRFGAGCGVSSTIDFNWLTNPANAEAQICIAIEFLKSLVGECGCDTRQLAAGYNGGGSMGACKQSVNCGPSAASQGGECIICSNESSTRAWECLWDDNSHTVCNATRNPNFTYTRQYVPQVAFCYTQF